MKKVCALLRKNFPADTTEHPKNIKLARTTPRLFLKITVGGQKPQETTPNTGQ